MAKIISFRSSNNSINTSSKTS